MPSARRRSWPRSQIAWPTRKPGDPAHVINLSLLPMSPSDGRHLGEVLAAGPVRILSRGYGSCRITSTVVRDTWWVQYVNGYGNPMVDSIEITDIPEVAVASAEDIAESAGAGPGSPRVAGAGLRNPA